MNNILYLSFFAMSVVCVLINKHFYDFFFICLGSWLFQLSSLTYIMLANLFLYFFFQEIVKKNVGVKMGFFTVFHEVIESGNSYFCN